MENNNISEELLKTDPSVGLSKEEATKRLKDFGPNALSAEKGKRWRKVLKSLLSPISLMFIAAAFLSYLGGRLFDAYFILILMFINFFVSFWQERKADNAIAQLNKLIRFQVKVKRAGKWEQLDSEELVPGDIIHCYLGDVIPADLKIVKSTNLSVNEAAVTGESLPVDKKEGDLLYSGAFIATGEADALVSATGVNTYFGKIISSASQKPKRSLLEKDILNISKSLSIFSFIAVFILSIVFFLKHLPILDTLTLDLSLIIAGIPIALPTVLTLIISLGVLKLSKENVVVRRLASLEDLANVDTLFTDKTGTLTKNKISVTKVIPYQGSEADSLSYAYLAASSNDHDIINRAVMDKAKEAGDLPENYKIVDFIPADSKRKRNSASLEYQGKKMYVAVGAPQIIAALCKQIDFPKEKFETDIEEAAEDGYRTLAVAVNKEGAEEKEMELVGLLFLSDELRQSASKTISLLKENGVRVKMLTGDHRAIAYRIGKTLGLAKEDVYSEVLPDDKYNLVVEGKKEHIVAVTGDGVNDLPAVKTADVGFAVSNAVAALKSTADIVLLSSGISVLSTAILEARKIFARLYSYSIYRISESLRLIITVFILGMIYQSYPLSPIQLILLVILNDIPIVSLAFNRVRIAAKPAKIEAKHRFKLSASFGLTGVVSSLLFLVILLFGFHYSWDVLSTAFFLKLTVSGHLLILVAHTKDKWYRYLPAKPVLLAVLITQSISTLIAVSGLLMTPIPISLAIFAWIWSIIWMQITDWVKLAQQRIKAKV